MRLLSRIFTFAGRNARWWLLPPLLVLVLLAALMLLGASESTPFFYTLF